MIDDLGGGTLAAGVGAASSWARLASVQFYATGTGEVIFQALPGSLSFAASLPGTSTGPKSIGAGPHCK